MKRPFLAGFRRPLTEWEGTATDLKIALEQQADEHVVKSRDWPKKPHLLSGEIKRIAPNLRRTGLDVEFGKESGKRFIQIMRTATQDSVQSVPGVQTPENAEDSSAHMDAAGRSQDAQNGDSVHDSSRVLRDQDAVDAVDASGAESQPCSDDDPVDFGWIDDAFQ